MICKECGKLMQRFGQVAFCNGILCRQYGVRIEIGDQDDTR